MFGVGEVLFFQKFTFFMPDSVLDCFLMILGGFGRHFGSQNGAKMDSKIDQKND